MQPQNGFPFSFSFPSQSNWIKAMAPCCKFVLMCQEDAINLVKKMEEFSNAVVGPYAFKPLEGMILKMDFDQLIKRGKLEARPNVQWLKVTAAEIIRDRYWKWLLLHPQLQPERVHPDKGLFLLIIQNVFPF
jgi:hypothetical protein